MYFGPTINTHMDTLPFVWCPLINIVILAATFPYYRAAVYFHGIGSFLISLYTIIVTVPILLVSGIINDSESHHQKYVHELIGLGCLSVILIQVILGVLCRLSNLLPSDSKMVLNIRRIHQIFGLVTVLFQKFQLLRFLQDENQKNKYLVLEIIAIVIYIYRKNFSCRMEAAGDIGSKNSDNQIALRPIKSLKELTDNHPQKDYAIFGNKVYDLSPLRSWHPAGYQIIQSVRNNQFERFIYGIYGPYLYPQISRYSHSQNVLNLLDQPIAQISIPSCYDGLSDNKTYQIAQLKLISQKSHIYEMHLKGQNNIRFHRYTHIEQLGRFYSLTLNGKMTRLYTCVNFIHTLNLKFLKQYLQNQQVQKYYENSKDHDGHIPLLFKYYEDGRMTNALVNGGARELKISEQKGEGLKLQNIQAGKVIIIAGGTGIYPFSDLIDHLYKDVLLSKRPQLRQELQYLNPLLKTNILQKYTFKIIASFDNIEELHPITKHQLMYIAQFGNKTNISLRIKEQSNILLKNITKIEGRFQYLIQEDLKRNDISKIIICGPARMNQSFSSLLKQKDFPTEKYLIL